MNAKQTIRSIRTERGISQETLAELLEILTFANRAAALTCSRSGAIPAMPTLAELSGEAACPV
jgi:fructokinase